MTKQRYLAGATMVVILIGAGLGIAMMVTAAPAVTKANFEHIREGMTQNEVEVILGPPTQKLNNEVSNLLPGFYEYEWEGEGCWATVIFHDTGRVAYTRGHWPRPGPQDSFRQKLRRIVPFIPEVPIPGR